jgi:putative tricarboxylic transport membrane protein
VKIPNIVISIILIIVAGVFYSLTFQFPKMAMQDTGPAFMPRIYCGILIILGIILFIQGIKTKTTNNTAESTMKFALTSMGFILVYLVIIPVIGFYLSTVIIVFGLLLFSKVRNKIVLVSVSLGTALFVYVFFGKLLKVSIPLGSLFS